MAEQLDIMDHKILNLLQQDSSWSVKDIAGKVGLSQSPTYERIKRLKSEGYIEKYVALVNREKLGKHLMVICTVTLKEQSIETLRNFERDIIQLDQVLEVMCIAGSSDYLLKIAIEDVNTYHTFVIEKISNRNSPSLKINKAGIPALAHYYYLVTIRIHQL
eukprot:gene17649-21045_t